MKWLRTLFRVDAELEARIRELTDARDAALRDCKRLDQRALQAQDDLARQNVELTKLRTLVREQTDADLALVSARIIADITRGESPKQSDIALQQSLAAQQRSMMSAYGNPLLGMGLGLSGIFGQFGQH